MGSNGRVPYSLAQAEQIEREHADLTAQLAASDAENERYAAELSQLLATVQKKQDEILAATRQSQNWQQKVNSDLAECEALCGVMENYTTMVDKLLNKPKEHLKQMEHKLAVSQAKLNALIANPRSPAEQNMVSDEKWKAEMDKKNLLLKQKEKQLADLDEEIRVFKEQHAQKVADKMKQIDEINKKTAETNARIVQKKMLLAAKRKGFSSRRGLGSGHVKGG